MAAQSSLPPPSKAPPRPPPDLQATIPIYHHAEAEEAPEPCFAATARVGWHHREAAPPAPRVEEPITLAHGAAAARATETLAPSLARSVTFDHHPFAADEIADSEDGEIQAGEGQKAKRCFSNASAPSCPVANHGLWPLHCSRSESRTALDRSVRPVATGGMATRSAWIYRQPLPVRSHGRNITGSGAGDPYRCDGLAALPRAFAPKAVVVFLFPMRTASRGEARNFPRCPKTVTTHRHCVFEIFCRGVVFLPYLAAIAAQIFGKARVGIIRINCGKLFRRDYAAIAAQILGKARVAINWLLLALRTTRFRGAERSAGGVILIQGGEHTTRELYEGERPPKASLFSLIIPPSKGGIIEPLSR